MANTKSAKKRARQTITRTARNLGVRNQVKTAMRVAREAVNTKGADLQTVLSIATSIVARAAKRGTMHKKTASRKISRLMKAASAKKAAPTTPTKKA